MFFNVSVTAVYHCVKAVIASCLINQINMFFTHPTIADVNTAVLHKKTFKTEIVLNLLHVINENSYQVVCSPPA